MARPDVNPGQGGERTKPKDLAAILSARKPSNQSIDGLDPIERGRDILVGPGQFGLEPGTELTQGERIVREALDLPTDKPQAALSNTTELSRPAIPMGTSYREDDIYRELFPPKQ
jgi:hypothetical protein